MVARSRLRRGGVSRRRNQALTALLRLATSAAALALANAGLDTAEESERRGAAGLALGTMFGSVRTIAEFDRRALTAGPSYVSPLDFANSVINAAAGHAAIWHGLRGANATIAGGASAGAQALGYAYDQLRGGHFEVLLAGGAEELSFEALLGFSRLRALSRNPRPLARDRDGSALGEGAALLVLERARSADARNAIVLGEILGHGLGFGPSRGGEIVLAAALAEAIHEALAGAGLGPEAVDLVSLGASGDPLLDAAEARGLGLALGTRSGGVPVMAVKGQLGESLGAAAALQTVALMTAIRHGRVPGFPGADAIDPDLGLSAATSSRPLTARHGLVTALDADGQAAALVVTARRLA